MLKAKAEADVYDTRKPMARLSRLNSDRANEGAGEWDAMHSLVNLKLWHSALL